MVSIVSRIALASTVASATPLTAVVCVFQDGWDIAARQVSLCLLIFDSSNLYETFSSKVSLSAFLSQFAQKDFLEGDALNNANAPIGISHVIRWQAANARRVTVVR